MMAAPRAAGVEMECDAEAEEGGEGGEPAVDGGGGSGRDFFEKCVGEEDQVVRLRVRVTWPTTTGGRCGFFQWQIGILLPKNFQDSLLYQILLYIHEY